MLVPPRLCRPAHAPSRPAAHDNPSPEAVHRSRRPAVAHAPVWRGPPRNLRTRSSNVFRSARRRRRSRSPAITSSSQRRSSPKTGGRRPRRCCVASTPRRSRSDRSRWTGSLPVSPLAAPCGRGRRGKPLDRAAVAGDAQGTAHCKSKALRLNGPVGAQAGRRWVSRHRISYVRCRIHEDGDAD